MTPQKVKTKSLIVMQNKRWFSATKKKVLVQKEMQDRENEVNQLSVIKMFRCANEELTKQLNELLKMKKFYEIAGVQNHKQIELRCHKHNNFIIVFCEKDKQLLCSNCLFSSKEHKGHRMQEAKKARPIIQADLKARNQQLKSIEIKLRAEQCDWSSAAISLDTIYLNSLEKLAQIHSKKAKKISDEYLNKKEQLTKEYIKHKQFYSGMSQKITQIINQSTYSHVSDQVCHIVSTFTFLKISQCLKLFLTKDERAMLLQSFAKHTKRCEKQLYKLFHLR